MAQNFGKSGPVPDQPLYLSPEDFRASKIFGFWLFKVSGTLRPFNFVFGALDRRPTETGERVVVGAIKDVLAGAIWEPESQHYVIAHQWYSSDEYANFFQFNINDDGTVSGRLVIAPADGSLDRVTVANYEEPTGFVIDRSSWGYYDPTGLEQRAGSKPAILTPEPEDLDLVQRMFPIFREAGILK